MVNQLQQLMHDSVASPPHDDADLALVLRDGRGRVRRRRRVAIGGLSLTVAGVVAAGALALPGATSPDHAPGPAASGVPRPEGPVLRLSDATPAVEGEHYRLLASHTNEDLESDNGEYLDGVTDDGLVLFRDAPDMQDATMRLALMDPATGEKDWLPRVPGDGSQLWPVSLEERRLVFTGTDYSETDAADPLSGATLYAVVLDREAREWTRLEWPGLPASGQQGGLLGPDGRLYVGVLASQGQPPEGGWPTGPDGEADDADAEGETYDLWSVSLTDRDDVRDEGMRVGAVAFTDDAMVWTDGSNGDAGQVHVRDLETGEERAFDPHAGERCNLLSFGATGEHIVMGQYCGTYEGGVRDDRVQVLDLDGDPVVTLQGSGVDGGLVPGSRVVEVQVFDRRTQGHYLLDLQGDRFLRLSDAVSQWAGSGGGRTTDDTFVWSTPVNGRRGATQWLGQLIE